MPEPLRPGSLLEGWTIEEVLAWGRRGGLYRVQTEDGSRLLKQLLFPPLEESALAARLAELREEIERWQRLELAQAILLERVVWTPEAVFLLLPEISGTVASLRSPDQPVAPSPLVVCWAELLAGLVQALQRRSSALALEVLEPDHVITDDHGHLVVVNPGWSALLWRGAAALRQRSLQDAFQRFGVLVVRMATGRNSENGVPAELSPGLVWAVGRCLSEDPSRCYANFRELRQGLQKMPVFREDARSQRLLAAREPLEQFTVPAQDRPRSLAAGRAFAIFALVCLLVGAGWTLLRERQHPRDVGAALAFASRNRVELIDERGRALRSWDFSAPVRSLACSPDGDRLFVSVQGASGLEVLDRSGLGRESVELGESPVRMESTPDGKGLLCLFPTGRVSHLEISGGKLKIVQGVQARQGADHSTLFPMADGSQGLVLLHPTLGLSLYGNGEARLADWPHRGLDSLLSADPFLFASDSQERTLYRFAANLSPSGRFPLPGGPGHTELSANAYRRQFWSVHSSGLVGVWSLPEATLLRQVTLESPALQVAPDPLGRLWLVDQRGKLVRVDSQNASPVTLADVREEVSGLVYLPERRDKAGQLPASPPPTPYEN